MNPKVSVMIPVYNGEAYLAKAIDSVLAQTYKEYEIVVVNDGSTDNSAKILKSYGDKIRCFYQDNQGLTRTRNKILSLAKGEFLAFIDQDDLWKPEKLEKQMKIMEQEREIGLVYSNCEVIGLNDKVICNMYKPEKLNGVIFKELLTDRDFLPLATVLIRKHLLEEVGGFDSGFEIAADYDVFLKICKNNMVRHIDETLAQYRSHDHNQSSRVQRTRVEIIWLNEYWQKELAKVREVDLGLVKKVKERKLKLLRDHLVIILGNKTEPGIIMKSLFLILKNPVVLFLVFNKLLNRRA